MNSTNSALFKTFAPEKWSELAKSVQEQRKYCARQLKSCWDEIKYLPPGDEKYYEILINLVNITIKYVSLLNLFNLKMSRWELYTKEERKNG